MGGAEESAEIDCLSASGTSGKRGGKCVMGWPALSWSHLLTSHPPRVTAGPLQARSQWRGEPNEAGHAHLEAAGSAPWWRRRRPACSGSRLPSCHTSSSPSSSPRQWHPTPVLLPGKSHGRRSLVGCSPGGRSRRTQLSNFTFTFHFHALEKEMATHSSVLAWRIPGTREPGGLPSMGSHRVGHD